MNSNGNMLTYKNSSRNNYSAYSGVNIIKRPTPEIIMEESRNNYSAYSGVNILFVILIELPSGSRNNYSAYSGVNLGFKFMIGGAPYLSRNNYSAYSGVNNPWVAENVVPQMVSK